MVGGGILERGERKEEVQKPPPTNHLNLLLLLNGFSELDLIPALIQLRKMGGCKQRQIKSNAIKLSFKLRTSEDCPLPVIGCDSEHWKDIFITIV